MCRQRDSISTWYKPLWIVHVLLLTGMVLIVFSFYSRSCIFALSVVFTILGCCVALDPPNLNLTQNKAHILPPCQACKSLVGSFKKVCAVVLHILMWINNQLIFILKGLERTARGKFEGGDADWEEKKLRSYANSEVRLVEIQEKLCSDVAKGEDQVNWWSYLSFKINYIVFVFPHSATIWLKLMILWLRNGFTTTKNCIQTFKTGFVYKSSKCAAQIIILAQSVNPVQAHHLKWNATLMESARFEFA